MLEKNLASFARRFPALEHNLRLLAENGGSDTKANLLFPLEDTLAAEAKNSQLYAAYKGLLLHSSYNPSAEAHKMLTAENFKNADTLVFFGAGLGYALSEAAQLYKNKTIVFVEPDPMRLLWAFSLFDWRPVFGVPSCVFLIEAPQQTVIAVLEHYGLNSCAFIAHKAWTAHAGQYFSQLSELVARNKNKHEINERTLEKFGFLWLSNMCKNLRRCAETESINRYKNTASSLPFCIIAAGPTLDDVLPLLPELKKRAVLVCVDTALRSCLRAGIEPHFIAAVDPQYWNARHLSGLESPDSVLITESAVYPSVLRFKCRKIVLCSSMFSLGRYIERFTGKREQLASGGSVASTAWDFARFCGATTVYTAGLDLSYPENKTHAKGSTFEETVHNLSAKLRPAETFNAASIYDNPAYSKESGAYDYDGKAVLSDSRMKLYAWWFESKCAAFPNVKTYALSSKSLCIPGITPVFVQSLLDLPEREREIEAFCAGKIPERAHSDAGMQAEATPQDAPAENGALDKALASLSYDLRSLESLAEHAVKLCGETEAHCKTEGDYAHILSELSRIDDKIRANEASDVASLIFPSASKLEKLFAERLPKEPPAPPESSYIECARYNIAKSRLVYRTVADSIKTHIHYLQKNGLFV